ncbi:T9SS type A sorting domain-containing protein [Kaistella sp.]|uniref:T9SS type A sorting domain-containing protein n=1 Tax=Kaistella sp. TaxID=2782235 RepID=UPI003C4E1029
MKKTLFAVAILGFMISINAQKSVPFSNKLKVENHAIDLSKKTEAYKKLLSKSSLNTFSNSAQNINFTNKGFDAKNFGGTPSGLITAAGWQQLIDGADNSKQLIQEDYAFGANAHVSIKLLNPNTTIQKELTVSIPQTANFYGLQRKTSKFNFKGNTKMKFFMFIHYFEGGEGPDFQKNAVWMIDEDGAILKKFEDTILVELIHNTDGSANVVTYNDDDTTVNIAVYDAALKEIATKQFDSELINFFNGTPLAFMDVDGEPKIVLAHYEKLFMDNSTMEVTPDNHLVIEMYNQNLTLEKQTKISLPAYEQDSYVFGMVEYGVFYDNYKYDITKHVFNADDKYEFLYGINYFDLMQDRSWSNYFVADEQGNTLKSLEDGILSLNPMKEIAGQEDQVSFILSDEEGNQSIKMFDIPSWQTVKEFSAVYNGELISGYYNRIPTAGSYQFLIALGEPVLEGNDYFGVINKYTPTGELTGKVKLNIGAEPLNFTPLLYSTLLEPKLFDADDMMEYNYVYMFKYPGNNLVYNSFNVAKENSNTIFTANGDETKGNVIGSGFLVDNNDHAYKMGVLYGDFSQVIKTTEFFDIPFEVLATSDVSKNIIKSYTDKIKQIIGFTEKLASYKVYSMSGTAVTQGKNAKEISTSGWVKGMYLIQYITENNTTGVAKVMIQ